MGCCHARSPDAPEGIGGIMKTSRRPTKQRHNHVYEVVIPSRPLYITVTSATNEIDAFITEVHAECPVEKEKIALNSKIISVNGTSVEGLVSKEIARELKYGSLPLKVTLVHPNGLSDSEAPVEGPMKIVNAKSDS